VEDRAAFSAAWFWNGRFFYFIFHFHIDDRFSFDFFQLRMVAGFGAVSFAREAPPVGEVRGTYCQNLALWGQ